MITFAAVMTGTGTGAISTIQVFGDGAEAVIKKNFKSVRDKPTTLKTGNICLGTIVDGNDTIDQVTIGCEGINTFAINCHGNTLIIEMIMQLLQKNGVMLITAEQLLAKTLTAGKQISTIEVEAKITQAKAKTIEGTKIIINQIAGGLNKTAQNWLHDIKKGSLEEIKDEAAMILEKSRIAKFIMYGCTVVLAGPANSGKSTLLNFLAGRQKAIVTDIKGTTRDWVSCTCKVGSLCAEVIDTAGLDEKLLQNSEELPEKQAQKKSLKILEKADLVLLVLDVSQSIDQFDDTLIKGLAGKKVLTVLNKSDLPIRFETNKLPRDFTEAVQISAKFGTGIENLLKKIQKVAGIADFDIRAAVCFTERQEKLLKKLSKTKSGPETTKIIIELLNGSIC